MAIQILPARLANQIAAGEVVERPASVVKELIENSLDAGATRIDIDIEQGGAKCIRIKDNGNGVSKEQLTLALSRHATSKISHLDDLEAIVSLGFRGEALASVSSVSRLTFTSKPTAQAQAWQAVAEGRDMQVKVNPAAHPHGTTVEVLDLFFNTPARRRFLKTEKTEFQHIDELIKRIALSRFDLAITLKHNHKVVRQYRAAELQAQQEKRISAICSEQFMQHAVFFEHADQALKISGWVSDSRSPRALADVQYCYINGRMIRDKLVNHAIKQTYAQFLPAGMFPGYIIYIECDAKEVDVNVHPAKHEVRFHQARWVHDFICNTLNRTLKDSSLLNDDVSVEQLHTESRVVEHSYQPPSANIGSASQTAPAYTREKHYPKVLNTQQVDAYCGFVAEAYQQQSHPNQQHAPANNAEDNSAARILSLVGDRHVLIQPVASELVTLSNNGLLLMSLSDAQQVVIEGELFEACQNGEVIAQPLLLPVRFEVDPEILECATKFNAALARLGFTYKFQTHFIIISQVPAAFRHAPVAAILALLFNDLQKDNCSPVSENDAVLMRLLCSKLSELLLQKTEHKNMLSRVESLLSSLIKLSTVELSDCFKQPDLSRLISREL